MKASERQTNQFPACSNEVVAPLGCGEGENNVLLEHLCSKLFTLSSDIYHDSKCDFFKQLQ